MHEVPAIDLSTEIAELGLDSVQTLELVACLEERLGIRLPLEALADVTTAGDLISGRASTRRPECRHDRHRHRLRHDVATLRDGMPVSRRRNVQQLWQLLLDGRDAFAPVPPQRWRLADFYDPEAIDPDRAYSDIGAFLDDIEHFPGVHFGMPPRRVQVMDPQQRLLLEAVRVALEDAAATPRRSARTSASTSACDFGLPGPGRCASCAAVRSPPARTGAARRPT